MPRAPRLLSFRVEQVGLKFVGLTFETLEQLVSEIGCAIHGVMQIAFEGNPLHAIQRARRFLRVVNPHRRIKGAVYVTTFRARPN